MIDKILKKYAEPEQAGAGARAEEADPPDDLGSFGWLRGVKDRALMLELRKRNGNITAVGYAWLEKAEFDPSDGITLYVSGQQYRIRGRNLNADLGGRARLFQGILRHRVPWIQEADESVAAHVDRGATIVEELEW